MYQPPPGSSYQGAPPPGAPQYAPQYAPQPVAYGAPVGSYQAAPAAQGLVANGYVVVRGRASAGKRWGSG
jgi:hypothetical protein